MDSSARDSSVSQSGQSRAVCHLQVSVTTHVSSDITLKRARVSRVMSGVTDQYVCVVVITSYTSVCWANKYIITVTTHSTVIIQFWGLLQQGLT